MGCPINNLTGDNDFVPLEDVGTHQLLMGEAPGEEEATYGRPFIGGSGQWLKGMLKQAGKKREDFCVANTMLCRPPSNMYPGGQEWLKAGLSDYQTAQAGLAYCWRTHVEPFLAKKEWSVIYALGAAALRACTGREGIDQWRGSPLPLRDKFDRPRVIPTYHPAFLMRSATYTSVGVRDLKKQPILPPEKYTLYGSLADLKRWKEKVFAFDFEWDEYGNITLCGLSAHLYHALVVPFEGELINELKRIFEEATDLIGQNIVGADTRYIERLGWDISKANLHDTMLMQHLVQPDMRHGLAFIASVFTNKVFWKGKDSEREDKDAIAKGRGAQWKTWCQPDKGIPVALGGYVGCTSADEAFRLYNARDVDATFQAYWPLKYTLQKYNQEHIYKHVSTPLGYIARDLGDAGLAIDTQRLVDVRASLERDIEFLDSQLPDGLRSHYIERTRNVPNVQGVVKPKVKVCKGTKKAPHPEVTLMFEQEGEQTCPGCSKLVVSGKLVVPKTVKETYTERVFPWNSSDQVLAYATEKGLKECLHPKTKQPSADKNARKVWIKKAPEFIVVDQLKKAVVQKNSFAKPGLIQTDRMYFNLLVHGTGEGRLSSTGKREGIDLNIQNIPEAMKVIFRPDHPDWCFLDFDISQGENRLTAWFAKDWERLERLADPNYDEHSETAIACTGMQVSKTVNAHLRKMGKITNHMLNYGAGWKKLGEVLAIEGFNFSAAELKEIIEAWKKKNAVTAKWQQDTIALATAQNYLENPFGRRRWFQTRDLGPKALAFLPASTLADCVLRMMIALHADRFIGNLTALGIGRYTNLVAPWRMVTQIHDSIVTTGPTATHLDAAERMKLVMEQPWPELNNFHFSVDGKVCTKSWGEAEKLKW